MSGKADNSAKTPSSEIGTNGTKQVDASISSAASHHAAQPDDQNAADATLAAFTSGISLINRNRQLVFDCFFMALAWGVGYYGRQR